MPRKQRPPGDDGLGALFDEEDSQALRRFLAWSFEGGFRLGVVEVGDLRQSRAVVACVRRLVAGLGGRLRVVGLHDLPAENLWESLRAACPNLQRRDVLALTGIERSENRERLIQQLNVQRDLFVRDLQVPWVLVLHRAAAADLQRRAPDFADYATLWVHARNGLGEAAALPASSEGERGRPAPLPTIVMEATGSFASLVRAFDDAFRSGEFDEARDIVGRIEMSLPPVDEVRAMVQLLRGQLAHATGDMEAAERHFAAALQRLQQPDSAGARAGVLREIARVRRDRGEPQRALRLLEEARDILHSLGSVRESAIVLGEIGRLRAARGEVEAALRSYQAALAVFDAIGDRRERAVTLGDIARVLAARGDVDEALRLHDDALAVFEALGERRERASVLGDIARLLCDRGELDRALELHQERLDTFAAMGARRSWATTLGDIARIHASRGDLDGARRLHEEALAVFEAMGDPDSRGVVLGDIARLHAQRGEIDDAIRLQKERLRIAESLGDVRGMSVAMHDLGRLDAMAGRYTSARSMFERAYQMATSLGLPDGIAYVGRDFGLLLAELEEPVPAREALTAARDAFRQLGMLTDAGQLDDVLASLSQPG
jgi:tetratricopeptide (TPR) repeat protein